MNVGFTYLAISLFSVVSAKVLDEDMLLYWRRWDNFRLPRGRNYGWTLERDKGFFKQARHDNLHEVFIEIVQSDSSKCEPFTTYFISCNKCVCSADGTSFCTRMACFKAPRFLTDEPEKITPVDDTNRHDQDDDDSQLVRVMDV